MIQITGSNLKTLTLKIMTEASIFLEKISRRLFQTSELVTE